MMNAVILAGDSQSDVAGISVPNKALLTICGKPMIEYVVDALYKSSFISNISIVGPVELLKDCLGYKVDYYVEDEGSFFENLNSGIQPFIDDKEVIIAASDIPMLTHEVVDDFINCCLQQKADLCYPIVEKSVNQNKFPGFERTYVKLKEGVFTGGNILCINPAVLGTCHDFTLKFMEYRKKPWKSARLLGLDFLTMLALGVLPIFKIEQRFSELLNIKAAAIISSFPELANDVDKPSDVEMVEKYLCAMFKK